MPAPSKSPTVIPVKSRAITIPAFAGIQAALSIALLALLLTLACGQESAPAASSPSVEMTQPPANTAGAPPSAVSTSHTATIAAEPTDSPAPAQAEPQAKPQQEAPAGKPAAHDELTPAQIVAAHDEVMGNLYETTLPSVVGLRVIQSASVDGNAPLPLPDEAPSQATGSGFVWDDQGHIVTNHHVVDGADRIIVVLRDGDQTDGEVVGVDPDSDLAVVKITDDAVRPPPISLGDSDDIRPGQLAVAIGDPFSRGFSMTSGIVSALDRTIKPGQSGFSVPRVIQHDAATNPGNSGGPLLNRNGAVIGINTQIISYTGAFSGVGLAVPINLAKLIVPSLIADGRYDYPFLGIRGFSLIPDIAIAMNLPANTRGALVNAVTADSAASRAGLLASDDVAVISGVEVPIGGDIIVGIDGSPISNMDDLIAYLVEHTRPGDTAEFTVLRDGEEIQLSVTIGKRPG